MLIDNTLYYENKLLIEINQPINSLYYYFDFDERSYDINMEFQHFHPFYEMHILLGDSANHIVEGTLYNMHKFDIACMRPSLLHKSEYPEGPAVKRLVIQFKFPTRLTGVQTELESILDIFNSELPIYRFERNDLYRIFEPLNEICKIEKTDSAVKNLLIHTKFIEFLSRIYENRSKNCYVPEVMDTATNKIYSVTAFIHSHFSEDLSLETLSKQFFISPYYLSHQFHAVTGFTLTNYIQMTRIRNAQQLLLYTDRKITEIAELCGFTSFSQFNRVFNKFCNASPRDFKSNNAKISIDLKVKDSYT